MLAIFQGSHSYVSPTWYQTAPAVPPWNYTSVHCYGKVSLLSVDELRIVMEALVHKFEPTLQVKEKLGQHRSQADQRGTLQGLINSQSSESVALADYMLKVKKGIGA